VGRKLTGKLKMLRTTILLFLLLAGCLQTLLGQPLRFRVRKVSAELF
jgi:hypothetical protein